jgi:c-di-GMP-related signal transduction protein
MSEDKYLVRTPLLDPQQRVKGYKLAWQKKKNDGDGPGEAGLDQLLALVAERVSHSPLGLLFLDARAGGVSAQTLQGRAPAETVLMRDRKDLVDGIDLTAAQSLRERGFGLALCDADLGFLESNESALALLSYVELGLRHPDLTAISRFVKQSQPQISVLVEQFADWREFDACAPLGLNGFFKDICLIPRKPGPPGELGPQSVLILQLMKMVQENADVRELEKLLKHDAVLSYRLLRYINSAGFGIDVEIQSLRHAVSMLGYTPFLRWLSLLLATTNPVGFSPALLQAAMIRGRFAELLGHGLLSKSEAENLFIVGMFSLLDQFLGIPVEDVLKQITLPEAIAQALLTRGGVYGPFLALAEACEREDDCASDLADALFKTAAQVNHAHLSALAWAQTIKL